MILYHGTNLNSAQNIYKTQIINVNFGSENVDFGPGFYSTTDRKTAEIWAVRKGITRNDKAAILIIDFDYENAKSYIEYFSDDLRWGRFLINNRNGINYVTGIPFKEHNIDGRYHITFGRIADLEVVTIAKQLQKTGQMLQSIDQILNKKYSMQYAFHTRFAVQFLNNIRYTVL